MADPQRTSRLHNVYVPTDKNSGRIWPVITLLLAATVAWVLQDSELRGGLADVLGIKALAPIVEEIVTHEYEIKLFGTWTSTCTQRVMVVAKEKDLDIDLHLVDMAGVSGTGGGADSMSNVALHAARRAPCTNFGASPAAVALFLPPLSTFT